MELIDDVWLFITRFSNGETRHNLSQTNKHFRNLITNHHIYLINQEQRRILSFVTDVESTTVQRFLGDFEELKNEWKPPENNLLLHYVDYHYHLLITTLFMLQKIESYHLFFYFTNNLALNVGNLVKQLLIYFKYTQNLDAISKAFSLTPKFENPFPSYKFPTEYSYFPVHFLHKKIFNKWDFDAVPFRSRYLITLKNKSLQSNSQYDPFLTMMARFFSPLEVLVRSKLLLGEDHLIWYLIFPADYFIKFDQKRRRHPPHFSQPINIENFLYSPYSHEQIVSLFQKEGLSENEGCFDVLMGFDYPHKHLLELFNSPQWSLMRQVFSNNVIYNIFFTLLDPQKLNSIHYLIKNWPHLFILFNSFSSESIILAEVFSILTIEQIDCFGNYIIFLSHSMNKNQFDSKIQIIINQLKLAKQKENGSFNINDLIHRINKDTVY